MLERLGSIIKARRAAIVGSSGATADASPFEYITVTTDELRIGDYITAYAAYIQILGAEEYDGKRTVTVRLGQHGPTQTFTAYAGDEFAVRVLRGTR